MRNGDYELVVAPPGYPGRRYRGKYAYEHHVVWWKKTGEAPRAGHLVHHRNGRKRDNRPANLEEKEWGRHSAEHGQRQKVVANCGWCGKRFDLTPSRLLARKRQSKSGSVFCCKSHQAQFQFRK